MSSKEHALAHLRGAIEHLSQDGLPAYPPPRPWPALAPGLIRGELWVFGYGSLIWHPGFPFEERAVGRVHGYHRQLCVWSWEYRGTLECPGLVLGLDRGGACVGVGFRIARARRAAVATYLIRRELTSLVYRPVRVPLTLADGRHVEALTFVVERSEHHYAGRLAPGAILDVVSRAHGGRGPNAEYVLNTHAHLVELGIPCARLAALAARLP